MEYLIKTNSIGGLTEEQFFYFCQENSSLKLERSALGDIIVMEPSGLETERYNTDITFELMLWSKQTEAGQVFGNNAGFTLPNKAVRSPDAAFIRKSRWDSIALHDRKKFAHICPDFIVELLSESDVLKSLQDKMKEWIDNSCLLAWLINPKKRETLIYRSNHEVEIKPFTEILYGEDILPGFSIDLTKIFTAD